MIGRAIDKVVGVFSPVREIRRLEARHLLEITKRHYAAAKTPKSSEGWTAVDLDVNTLISGSSSIVRGRVRQLVRDFPYLSRAVNVITNLTVGGGIALQARVKNKAGDLDKPINTAIEDAFARWSDMADVSGKLDFDELTELAKRNMLETGEYIFIKRYLKEPGRIIPFALQAIEPERLAAYGVMPGTNNLVHDGIEFDSTTGKPLFYHFVSNGYTMKPFKVPASDVIHGFKTLRPGQVRGISMFTPVVLLAKDLNDFMDATLDRAKLAAKWLAFIKTANPLQFQAARGVKTEEYTRIEEIENALIEYLRPGEEVQFSSGAMPGDVFGPYVKLVLRMIAVGCGVSYELLSGDYDGISYSNLRGIRNDLAKDIVPHQTDMVRHFCHPVFCDVLDWMVYHGSLKANLTGYMKDPYVYQRALWMPPGMESIDPLKESKANTDQVQNLLRSPQEVCRSRGRDLEDVLDEIKEFKQMCDDRGLEVKATSKAIAQNPAALGAGDTNANTTANETTNNPNGN